MVKKLLKHDFHAILKYWWIGALITFILTLLGAASLYLSLTVDNLPVVTDIFITLFVVLVFFSYAAFYIMTALLIYIRFYKNFFTDEGYLTFTLPVKRSQLLTSKLIVGVSTYILTTIVIIINVVLFIVVGLTSEFSSDFVTFYASTDFPDAFIPVPYLLIYLFEGLLAFILSFVISVLFVYFCITFASLIAKKGKIAVALVIYYVANGFISTFVQLFSTLAITGMTDYMAYLPNDAVFPLIALIAGCFILLMAVVGILLYTIVYWMLDRKLNLS